MTQKKIHHHRIGLKKSRNQINKSLFILKGFYGIRINKLPRQTEKQTLNYINAFKIDLLSYNAIFSRYS